MRVSQKILHQLIEAYAGKCPICGRTNVELGAHHIAPISAGGANDITNLAVMCRSCSASLDRHQPSEAEFAAFLVDLVLRHPDFADTVAEKRISKESGFIADIETTERHNKTERTILVECKRTAFFTDQGLHQTIAQINTYRAHSRLESHALAFPGRLSLEQQRALSNANIDLWDIDFIARRFPEQIKSSDHLFFKNLFLSVAPFTEKSPQIQMLERLKLCQAGKSQWPEYQRIIGQVFESLFCPPLQAPLSESADAGGTNRRDLIFPDYSDQGFWRFLRDMYKADYIVIDAKNYRNPIGKTQVLQIANYLKPHGAGMFAFIATRSGANKAARLTIREQWMAHQKMILVLDDKSIQAMLLAASAGGDPSKVVGQMIEDFRLSM